MAQPPSPEHRPPGAGTAGRTRLLALLVLACVSAALLWAGRGQWADHQAWWFGPAGAHLAPRWAALSPAMDEAALQRHLHGVALVCADGAAGERRCQAALAQADGVPAARLQALLADSRLRSVEVWVPWWEHHSATRQLVASLGAPASHSTGTNLGTNAGMEAGTEAADPPSIAWALSGGALRIARHPGWNPWRWIRLRWVAEAPS